MGILIVLIVLAVIFGIVAHKTDNTIIDFVTSVISALFVVCGCVLGLVEGINFFGKDIEKYITQNRKERIETLLKETESPFYSTFKDSSLVFNNNIKANRKLNESFWTYGLGSYVEIDTITLK